MGYSLEEGFVSRTVEEIKNDFRLAVNKETGSEYTAITFTDSNWDRIANVVAQVVCLAEQTMSAGWDNVREYVNTMNQVLGVPYASLLGLIDYFNNTLKIGTKIKQPTEAEAGQIFLALDLTEEEFENRKDEITATLIDRSILNYYFAGSKSWTVKLANGQDWRFACQLAEDVNVYLDIQITRSRKNESIALDANGVKELFLKNLKERLTIGDDGEWGKVLNLNDIPWAGNINIGYKDEKTSPTYIYEQKPVEYYQKIVTTADNINVIIKDI